MIGRFWKKHFALRQIYPFHENPIVFVTCQWQRNKSEPNLKYLVYRTILTLFFIVPWAISIDRESGHGKWPIFLTNWGFTLCTTQAVIGLFLLVSCVLARQSTKMRRFQAIALRLYPTYWVLNTLATSTAFAITVVYWTKVYNVDTMKLDEMNYLVHGNNSVLMFIDLWMVSHPVRILHVVYTIVFGFTYTLFTLIYYSAGGTSRDGSRCIYKIVDWDKPLPTSLTCLGVIVFLVVLHMLAVLVADMRRRLDEKCCSKEQDTPPMSSGSKSQAAYVNEGMSVDIV
ncbi:unnamed protein product [Phaedon cochleariae]|uniref:Protein rolling stone n=1 Tax=Phaedon cochleariae TaxID=80249 RepID=A0A9P0GTG7_PHACE|nr:unnamed protein product [Phaedon cochleariae]